MNLVLDQVVRKVRGAVLLSWIRLCCEGSVSVLLLDRVIFHSLLAVAQGMTQGRGGIGREFRGRGVCQLVDFHA